MTHRMAPSPNTSVRSSSLSSSPPACSGDRKAGVLKGGGEVIGLSLIETKYPGRSSKMNPFISKMIHVNTLSERLETFAESEGYLFFSGGIGTLSEFAFVWHSRQLEADFDRPLVLFSGSWKRILAQVRNEQMIKFKYFRLIHLCEKAKDAVAVLAKDFAIKYDDPDHLFYKDAVLFDLDGTLVESPEEEFVRSCESLGLFFHMADVRETFRRAGRFPRLAENEKLFFSGVLENLGLTIDGADEMAEYVMGKRSRYPSLYHDVVETLREFRGAGLAIGIISGRPLQQVEEILSAHNLTEWVDFVCPVPYREGLPGRQRIEEAVRALGLAKESIVFIGDDLHEDYLDPRADDVDAILLDRYLTHIANDTPFKIRSLEELRCLVKPRNKKN